jgi:hypothetical protein
VFPAARPLEFNIRAAETGRPLVAVAYCRGVQVGQQPLITKVSSSGANPVAIDLDEAVAGVIRLVVYDYGVSPPKPVAERLVYRLPMQKLKVRVDGLNAKYKPGELAKMSLMVTDESDRPVAAAMSVAVVDPAVSGSPSSCLTPLPVYFLLTGEIEIPKGFCIADFKVSETTKDIGPAAALDLLLGVQTPSMAAPAPPLMFDNLARIRSNYEKSLMEYQADRVPALDTLTTVGFFGGLGLVLLVAMLGLMGIVSGIHLWIAAIGATTCCLIIGAILTDPGRLAMGQEATVSFSPFSDLEKRPTQDDTDHLSEPTFNPDLSLKMGEKSTIAGTAYWNPLLIAGSDGKAAIQFPLPKTAAKFRLSIQAHDAGRLGQGQAEIVSENTP